MYINIKPKQNLLLYFFCFDWGEGVCENVRPPFEKVVKEGNFSFLISIPIL